MQYSFRSSRIAVLAACLAIPLSMGLYSAPAFSQGITTGGISGSVVDPAGSVIPFAKITIVGKDTGAKYEQTVQGNGDFSLSNLQVGVYTVTISANGFTDLKIENVNVTVGVLSIGKETLSVGNGGVTTIEASAVAPLLSTEQSQVSVTMDSEALSNLPFAGGFDTVALLTPGVSITHDNSFSNNNGAYGGFSANGERGRSNNFEIDGQSNNDNSVAGPQVFFSNQDALQAVEVITNNFSAQYGRNAGSVVNYLTKSGTNQYHGSVFEFYEGNWGESFAQGQKSAFNGYCQKGEDITDGCQVPSLPRYTRNRFGGTFGGPIPGPFRDKVWYFGSAYFDRNHNGGGTSTSGTSITPDEAGLATLQAAFPNAPGVAALVNSGPYSIKTGNPHPVGTPVLIPTTVTNADGTTTTANVEMAAIGRSVPSQANDEELLGRIDWQITAKDHLFIRYFYQDDPFVNAGGSVPAGNWYNVPDTAHSVGADLTHTFSPTVVNQVRYSFQETALNFQSGAIPSCTGTTPGNCTTNISLSGSLTDTAGNGHSNLSYGYATNIPQGRTVKVTQAQDNVTWTHGKQTILFGGEYDYQNSPNPFLPDYNGAFTFGPNEDASRNAIDQLLAGIPGSVNLANSNSYTTKFTENDAAAYFQDDYKVTSNLTLNLGLRWEFFGQAVNLLHDETVKRESNPATAFWDQSLPLANRTVAGAPNNYKDFQPRIGLAFNPSFDKKLVVRAGFSINFDPAFYNIFLNVASAAPVVNLGTLPGGCGVSYQCLPSTDASSNSVRALDLQYIPLGGDPGFRSQTNVSSNFHDPYTESYLLGVSHQIGNHAVLEVNYVGNHQIGNFQSINANPLVAKVQQAFPSQAPVTACTGDAATVPGVGRLDCTRGLERQRNNGAWAIYNAVEGSLTTSNFHGLSSKTNLTIGRTLDNTSEIFSTGGGGNTNAFAQNALDPNVGERGLSGDSERLVASSNFSYVTPKIHGGSGLLGRALSNYRLDTIWTFNTATAATPYQYHFYGFGLGAPFDSYCDEKFAATFIGLDNCRPVLSNPKAPLNATGIIDDGTYCATEANPNTAGLVFDPWSCAQTTLDAVHWLRNSKTVAAVKGTPYGGVGRNTYRAQAWNNFDASIQKETKIKERVVLVMSINLYNALNRQYLGTPDMDIDDGPGDGGTLFNYAANYGTNRTTQLKLDIHF